MGGIVAMFLMLTSFVNLSNPLVAPTKYKCMVQLTNYTGEGAYIVVSILDAEGEYVKTLQVLGDDEKWYPDLPKWWAFHKGNNKPAIDGITGATIAGGERAMFMLEIDSEYIDQGYQLRFETSVEHQKYIPDDLVIPLSAESLSGKFEGTGYIRYVRILAQS